MMMMMMMVKKRYKGEESVEREHDEQRRSYCACLCVLCFMPSRFIVSKQFFLFFVNFFFILNNYSYIVMPNPNR